MKKSIIIRILVFTIFCILTSFLLVRNLGDSVVLDIRTDTPTALTVFYDNGDTDDYHYDESHMTQEYPLAAGQQTVRIHIPAESMDYLRLDFGTQPATVAVYSMTLVVDPFKSCTISGDVLLQLMQERNDISSYWLEDSAAVFLVSGTDGYIAARDPLLNEAVFTVPTQTLLLIVVSLVLGVMLSTIDLIVKTAWRLLLILGSATNWLKKRILSPTSNQERASGLVFSIVTAAVAAVVLDGVVLKLIYYTVRLLGLDTLSRYFSAGQTFSLARAFFFFFLLLIPALILWLGKKRAIKYRYLLALLLLCLMTMGKYTGSSLGYYDFMLQGNTPEYHESTLLGIPQGIRGDEWATEKPYYFAQVNGKEDMPYYNSNLMIDGADMVVSAFAPVKDIMILFRPALTGFLFLPPDFAFAFYWWWKLIALFMAAFELLRLLTGRIRYAVLGAFIFVFAPASQWWLSQTLIEIITYGFFALVLYDKFLTENRRAVKIVSLAGVFYSLTIYILTMYPATQVPIAYILLPILIWICWRRWSCRPFSLRHIFAYVLTALPFAGVLIRFVSMSGPAMTTILNTIYPGNSRTWIRLPQDYALYQIVNPFTALIRHPDFLNSSEISQYYTFAIVLIPLMCYMVYRYRKKVLLPAILCAFSTVLLLVAWLPEVPLLNRLTLLGMSYPVRIYFGCGVGYTLVILTLLPMLEKELIGIPRKYAGIACSLGGFVLLCAATQSGNVFGYMKAFQFGTLLFILIILLFSYMAFLLMTGGTQRCRRFVLLLTGLCVVSTLTVNPITRGTDSMFEKSTMEAIRTLDKENPGRWMVSGNSTISDLVTAQGVARVSGTYYYPDWTMMQTIDPDHRFEHFWNQFAHIDMRLTMGAIEVSDFDHERNLKVDGTGRIIIYVDIDTARELGIRYIFTSVGVPQGLVDDQNLILRYEDAVDPWLIYELQ